MMNSGPSSDGSYQHEVIVGDEDPSLSFVGSPSWTHTFEDISTKDDILAISLYDSHGGIGHSLSLLAPHW